MKFLTYKNIKRDVLTTSFVTVFGRSFGFFVPILIAAWYGVNRDTDVFFLAYSVIIVLQVISSHVMESVVVPFVAELQSQKRKLDEFIGSVFARSFFVALAAIGLLLLAARFVLPFVTRFDPSDQGLMLILVAEMCPAILFSIWADALNGALQAHKHFHVPALSPGYRSLLVIVFMYFFKGDLGVHAIAAGFTFGEMVRFLVTYLFYLKKVGGIKLGFYQIAEMKSFFQCAFYQLVGFTFISFIPVVNQSMASWLSPGDMSIYAYAERLRNVMSLFMSTALVSVVYSYWSSQYSRGPEDFPWKKIEKIILKLFGVVIVVSGIVVFFRTPLAALAFQRGVFPAEEVPLVATISGILIVGIPFQFIYMIHSRFLIMFKSNAAYAWIGFGLFVISILLNYVLMIPFGIKGIAASNLFLEIIFAWFVYQQVKKTILTKHAATWG